MKPIVGKIYSHPDFDAKPGREGRYIIFHTVEKMTLYDHIVWTNSVQDRKYYVNPTDIDKKVLGWSVRFIVGTKNSWIFLRIEPWLKEDWLFYNQTWLKDITLVGEDTNFL